MPTPRRARTLVFPTARGAFRGASALYRRLAISGEAAGLGLKVGPQALRRTFSTLAVTAGVDSRLRQSAVGDLEDRVRARRAPAPTPPTSGPQKEKALGIQGLFRERDTGFEPATFSLGS